MQRTLKIAVGLAVMIMVGPGLPVRRNERGLSQSTENAVLLAGVVTIAAGIIAVITAFVKSGLDKVQQHHP